MQPKDFPRCPWPLCRLSKFFCFSWSNEGIQSQILSNSPFCAASILTGNVGCQNPVKIPVLWRFPDSTSLFSEKSFLTIYFSKQVWHSGFHIYLVWSHSYCPHCRHQEFEASKINICRYFNCSKNLSSWSVWRKQQNQKNNDQPWDSL